jgi:sugar O-acyltransferase (sialic acid O-acetyltransferase NeuD family)
MIELIIIGGGGHAKSLLAVLHKLGRYTVVGYTDREDRGSILGTKYLGGDDVLNEYRRVHQECQLVLGIGSVGISKARLELLHRLRDEGFQFPAIVSPQAVLNADVENSAGTVIFDGAVVNTCVTIGECAIINTNSTVEHDCRIGNNVHVSPGATVCGDVFIGDHTFIGAGATIIHGVKIGAQCIIGAGATVIHDCLEIGTYVGTPARRLL